MRESPQISEIEVRFQGMEEASLGPKEGQKLLAAGLHKDWFIQAETSVQILVQSNWYSEEMEVPQWKHSSMVHKEDQEEAIQSMEESNKAEDSIFPGKW